MNNEKALELRYKKRLDLFTNGTDDQLASQLKPVEELDGINGFSVSGYMDSPLCGFHPEAVRLVTRDDDYFLGSRADCTVLVFGWSEAMEVEVADNEVVFDQCVVSLANHKGGLQLKVFRFIDDEKKIFNFLDSKKKKR
jgi:hypothetical protein